MKGVNKRKYVCVTKGQNTQDNQVKRTKTTNKKMSAMELRQLALQYGTEKDVEVNQRCLIDKMLARYANSFGIFRELIQNADDASATSVTIDFHTSTNPSSSSTNIQACSQIDVINNGNSFTEADWQRIAKIAEGNPNEMTVGMFGVGFYSVFAITDEPIIKSNGECLLFFWKGDKLSTARMSKDPSQAKQKINGTSFVLLLRQAMQYNIEKLQQFLANCLCFSKHVDTIRVLYSSNEAFVISKNISKKGNKIGNLSKVMPKLSEEFSLFNVKQIVVRPVTIQLKDHDTLDNYNFELVEIQLSVSATKEFRSGCKRILKKDIPSSPAISLLFSTNSQTNAASKFQECLDPINKGRVFVGLATHQTTGCGFHLAAHLYPTIERENIDFQDKFLAKWNGEMISVAGYCSRLYYNYKIKSFAKMTFVGEENCALASNFLSAFEFRKSIPSPLVHQLLCDSFFLDSLTPPLVFSNNGLCSASIVFTPNLQIEDLIVEIEESRTTIMEDEDILCVSAQSKTNIVPGYLMKKCPSFYEELAKRNIGATKLSIEELLCVIEVSPLLESILANVLKWILMNKAQLPKNKAARNKQIKRIRFHSKSYNYNKLNRERNISIENSLGAISKFAGSHQSGLPIPPDTLPSMVAEQFITSELSFFGWKLLDFVSYANWIFENKKKEAISLISFLEQDGVLASNILHYFATNIATAPINTQKKVTSLLQKIKCIPTKLNGSNSKSIVLRLPSEAYHKAAVLNFKNLPVATFQFTYDNSDTSTCPKLAEINSSPFLKKIGINLKPPTDMLLSSLASNIKQLDMKRALEYLLANQKVISAKKEWECLQNLQFLNCINIESKEKVVCSPLECYFSSNIVNEFGFSVLCWYDDNNELVPLEGETLKGFMKTPIGKFLQDKLRVTDKPRFPHLLARIQKYFYSYSHPSSSNVHEQTKFKAAINYLLENFGLYSSFKTEYNDISSLPFVPTVDGLQAPGACFLNSNPFFPTVDEFFVQKAKSCSTSSSNILRLIGIKEHPEIGDILTLFKNGDVTCAAPLLNEKGRKVDSKTKAMFEYLGSRLEDFKNSEMQAFKKLAFIPVATRVNGSNLVLHLCGKDVFFGSSIDDETMSCSERFGCLLSYVDDYGQQAAQFLRECGVRNFPSAVDLAIALVKNYKQYFASEKDTTNSARFTPEKYLMVLRQLALNYDQFSKQLKAQLKNIPIVMCCYKQQSTEEDEPTFVRKFVKPHQGYLIDNSTWQSLLEPIFAVMCNNDAIISEFFEKLGCKWLTKAVTEKSSPTGKTNSTSRSSNLQELIKERLPLILHSKSGEKLPFLSQANVHEATTILSAIEVKECAAIKRILVFQGKEFEISKRTGDQISMCTHSLTSSSSRSKSKSRKGTNAAKSAALFILASSEIDYFDIGNEVNKLLRKCLKLSSANSMEYGTVIARILGAQLSRLQAQGWAVDRLLSHSTNTNMQATTAVATTYASSDKMEIGGDAEIVYNTRSNNNSSNSSQKAEKVKDFKAASRSVDREIRAAIQSTTRQASTSDTICAQDYEEMEENEETKEACRMLPNQMFNKFGSKINGVQTFIEEGIDLELGGDIDKARHELIDLLVAITALIPSLKVHSVHVFLDEDDCRIAFNHGKALFFNIRYYYQCHYNSRASKQDIVTFWTVTMCHELAHNVELYHNHIHGSLMESMICKLLPKVLHSICFSNSEVLSKPQSKTNSFNSRTTRQSSSSSSNSSSSSSSMFAKQPRRSTRNMAQSSSSSASIPTSNSNRPTLKKQAKAKSKSKPKPKYVVIDLLE